MKKYIIWILILFWFSLKGVLFACTVFTSSSADMVLAGNNEDMCTTNTAIRIIPASEGSYGRIMWGFIGDDNFQGGMNEYGLFFDGAGTPPVEMENWNSPDFGDGFIFEVIIEKCRTVNEAIEFIKGYSLPYLKFCHILMADATGDAVIVEWGNNKLNFLRKANENYLVATNFNISESSDPEKECRRYSTASNMLKKSKPTIGLYTKILSLTHVEGKFPTVYSTICDLEQKKVYLYNFHNFSYCKEIDLNIELKGGDAEYMIRSFFPVSVSELMFRMMNDCIDDFENAPVCKLTFTIETKNKNSDLKLFLHGSAEELGKGESPGIELKKIDDHHYQKSIAIKKGKILEYTVSSYDNNFHLIDCDQQPIRENVIEVESDTSIILKICDWKSKN